MAPESESDAILSQAKTRLPWLVETWLFGDINPRSNMKAANIWLFLHVLVMKSNL